MKRISTALVAAATAAALVATPAFAEEAPVAGGTSQTGKPDDDQKELTPEEQAKLDAEEAAKKAEAAAKKAEEEAKKAQKGSGNNGSTGPTTGSAVGTVTGIVAAVLTTALIVFSNPTGINKAVDMLNAQFGLGLPHFTLF